MNNLLLLNSKKSILVTGSLAFDQIMTFPGKFSDHILPDKIHALNLSFLVDSMERSYGGVGGNIAYTLGLFGEQPILLSVAGKDFVSYRSHLKKHGVNTSHIKTVKNMYTANAFIVTDRADNQIAGFYPGAIAHADTLQIEGIKKSIGIAIISPDKPEAMIHFSQACYKLCIPFFFDPAQQLPRLSKADLLACIHGAIGLIGNDYELALFLERCSLTKKELLQHVSLVVTTKGPEGSILETSRELVAVKATPPKKVVDPTGAGDAYRAGLLWGLRQEFSLEMIGNVASLAATYAVEKQGTQRHEFTRQSFAKRFHQCYNTAI